MSRLRTLYIDLDGELHDTGAEVPEDGAGSVYPWHDGRHYVPIGSVNGRALYAAVDDERWEVVSRSIRNRGGSVDAVLTASVTGD